MSNFTFKTLEKIELSSYIPEEKVYSLSCRLEGASQDQLVFIPSSFFLAATACPKFKEEEAAHHQDVDNEADLHTTFVKMQKIPTAN